MRIVKSTLPEQVLLRLVPLLWDLSRELPRATRYQRLLEVLKQVIPCDAAALLRLDDQILQPVAVDGLGADTLGRRFQVASHPRLQQILAADGAFLFPPDCGLPDPYDGLVELDKGLIHDCMGCAIHVDNNLWGALTMDSLQVGQFSDADLPLLEAFASLAAASIAATHYFETLRRRAENERLRAEAYRLQASDKLRPVMQGRSDAFGELEKNIDLVAGTAMPVLITGETGVGKELVARAIHARSPRADRPLVTVNCAALSENLLESELFGHIRGAFSGATQDRPGKFQMADKGTLLLDEVGELPLRAQAKLLRALQDGQLQRVGSDRDHHVDVRILAATNRDLANEVKEGHFRMDLYHRLTVFPLRVPALRERASDILQLAGTFAEENRQRMGLRALRFSGEAQRALLDYPWPGNIRELEHTVARAALKARAGQASALVVSITPFDLGLADRPEEKRPTFDDPDRTRQSTSFSGSLRRAVEDFQRHQIQLALAQQANNVAATARALGLDRANLTRLAKRLNIPLPHKRNANKDQDST